MNVEALNCRCCGGVLEVKSALCTCKYCGATNFVSPTAEKYITQLNRANKLRQEKEYDNAIRIYDNILSENVPTADILWLRTLCEYGIEYVPDPISSKFFPTLHRIKDESILNYHSYIEALKLCDDKQKEVIVKEASEINRIQSEYLEIAKNEAPYDVFICYKETDEDTKGTTEDVAYCTKLYEILTKQGYKVFFARVTLEDKLSVDFEPYIFAALKSSKVMAVIGSKSEYFTATWVKNEWSRFLKLMETDMKKQIFFACDDPEELPRAFSLKQAQLLSNPDAMEILARNINYYLTNILKENKNGKPVSYEPGSTGAMYEDALKKSLQGNYAAVLSITSDLIEVNPGMPEAYWLRMAANIRHNPDNLKNSKKDFTQDPDYEKAISLADEILRKQYIEIKDACLNNLRLQNEFNSIMDKFADEYEEELKTSEFGSKKRILIREIEKLIYDINNASGILSSTEKLEVQRELKVAELDKLFKDILNDLQNKAIAKYRSFCSQNNISNKTEIDMESANYGSLRAELVEESKALHKKYSQPEAFLAGSEIAELKNKKEPTVGEMVSKMMPRDY
ncbi:MAG: toll/interleukin-1 receptor domain-containing protein [Lachnospiraceae bacterium]|nr:toll/interleukin-1 receptor domain-containing protein [Lachnospiraceae bacterium]